MTSLIEQLDINNSSKMQTSMHVLHQSSALNFPLPLLFPSPHHPMVQSFHIAGIYTTLQLASTSYLKQTIADETGALSDLLRSTDIWNDVLLYFNNDAISVSHSDELTHAIEGILVVLWSQIWNCKRAKLTLLSFHLFSTFTTVYNLHMKT